MKDHKPTTSDRCAKCNSPLLPHHKKHKVQGKVWHTSCFRKAINKAEPMKDKTLEETAREITDLFFSAGLRVSQTHYEFIVEKLQERENALLDRVVLEKKEEKIHKTTGLPIWDSYNVAVEDLNKLKDNLKT